MRSLLAALFATVAVVSAAQADSTYERSCYKDRTGATQCTSSTESENGFSETRCSHERNGDTRCQTSDRSSRIPEPTIDHVVVGGKTINVMRGLPR
jgi:hypothetical protein